jgi:16S rRNA (uracil1498-N3)-methyltransferase
MPAAHAFVEDVRAPVLGEGDRHHFERVLRLRAGEEVTVADGAGTWRRCRYAGGGDLEPLGEVVSSPAPRPVLTVAFALTKGERPELTVQKLTELGVDRIIPFAASRSVARWEGDRASRHVERLRKVAREAAMQSRRVHLPAVDEVADFAAVAALPGAAMADAAGESLTLATPTVLIGPEGGWDDSERRAGLPLVRLGPQVLRAETAAMAVGTLLTALRSGVVCDAPSCDDHGGSLP